jgi:hypothetical protein
MLINKEIFFVHNKIFKALHAIGQDALYVFEYLVLPDRCHDLQPSEMAGLSSYVLTFQRARSRIGSSLINNVGEEDIQVSS